MPGPEAATSAGGDLASPRPGRPPLALVAAIVLAVVTVAGLTVWRLTFDHEPEARMADWAAYRLVSFGLAAGMLGLLLVGTLELRQRSTGWARTAASIALGAAIAQVGTLLITRYVFDVYLMNARLSADATRALVRWILWLDATPSLIFALGIGLTAWRLPRARWLVVPLLLVQYMAAPIFIESPLSDWIRSEAGVGAMRIGLELVVAGLLVLVLVLAPAPARPARWERVAEAFDRLDRALVLRLWVAGIGAALVLLLWAEPRATSLTRLWLIGVPVATTVTGLLLAEGGLSASGNVDGWRPRLALLVAGFGLTAVVAMSGLQQSHLVRLVLGWDHGRPEERVAVALPVALPVLGAAAYVALAGALVAVARALRGASALTDAAVRAWTIVLSSQLLALAAPYMMSRREPVGPSTMVAILLLAAAAGIVSIVQVMRVAREVALAARSRGHLPVATIHAG